MWRTDQCEVTARAVLDQRARESRLQAERRERQFLAELRPVHSWGFASLYWLGSRICGHEAVADESSQSRVTEASCRGSTALAHGLSVVSREANATDSDDRRGRGRARMRAPAAHRRRGPTRYHLIVQSRSMTGAVGEPERLLDGIETVLRSNHGEHADERFGCMPPLRALRGHAQHQPALQQR